MSEPARIEPKRVVRCDRCGMEIVWFRGWGSSKPRPFNTATVAGQTIVGSRHLCEGPGPGERRTPKAESGARRVY